MDYTRTDDTKQQELQNVKPDGSAPRRRLATPNAAASIFTMLKDEDWQSGAKRRAVIQGMIDGNPPYDDRELAELGLSNLVNVNFMTMRANLDARAAAGHELFVEVPTLVECKPLAVVQNTPDVYHYCSVIAEEFTDLVTNWDGFLPCMDLIWRDSDAYGIGFGIFENEWDWRLKAFRRGNLLMDPKSSVEVDKNDFLMVRDEMSVAEVYHIIEDEAIASERGWNPAYLKDLLVSVFVKGETTNGEDKYQRSTWESVQQMVRNNDPEFQQKQFEKVRIVHIFVKEVSGEQKISHLIIPENCAVPMFLYEGYDRYDKMSNIVWWLPYNYGDGYARSVRGVASLMVQHDDLSNRFLCRVFDAGFMTSSLLLRPNSQMDLSRLAFMQHGPLTILPPETSVIQSTFQPQLQPLISLRQVSEEVMKNNTGTYRQHNEAVGNDVQKTARQVVEETSKEARFEKAAIAARYVHLDKLYREMFRRVCSEDLLTDNDAKYPGGEEAKQFFKRCTDRGVPKEFIFKWSEKFRVTAFRAVGLGSLGVKYDITNQLLANSGSFDETGKRAALRDWTAARVGYKNVDKYVATLDRDQISSNETSIAMLEFNDVEEGAQVVVGSDQVHKLHIDAFIQRLAPIIQAAQQQQIQDPVVAYRTCTLAVQHITGHLQYLAQDARYKGYVQQVTQFLQEFAKIMQLLEQDAKRVMKMQQQQQQQQQQLVADAESIKKDRELEAKIYEINKKYEVETMKQNSLNQAREIKSKEQMGIARAKAAEGVRLKAEEQAVKLQLETQKAQADIAIKQAKGK